MFNKKERYASYDKLRDAAEKTIRGDWLDLHETDMGVDGKKIDAERLIGVIELLRLMELEIRDLHRRLDELESR